MSSREINELYTRLRDLETRLKSVKEILMRAGARMNRIDREFIIPLVERMRVVEEDVKLIKFALRKAGILEG